MGADFIRIRSAIDRLQPSFPAALDRAFTLMKQHELEHGGDKHHGLMKSIWSQYKDFRRNPWNLVRLPHQIHVEVHVLMAAAFVGTEWFLKFNSARVVAIAGRGSMFDSLLWQERIAEFTKSGVLFVAACINKYPDGRRGTLHQYANNHGMQTANTLESKIGLLHGSMFDSRRWQKRITKFTKNGILFVGACATTYGAHTSSLHMYARNRGIRTADMSESRKKS